MRTPSWLDKGQGTPFTYDIRTRREEGGSPKGDFVDFMNADKGEGVEKSQIFWTSSVDGPLNEMFPRDRE